MLSAKLFNITTIFYMASTLAFLGYLAGRNKNVGLGGVVLAWGGFAIHTVATLLRWKESYDIGLGHAPLSNLYESVVFFAWSIVLIFGLIDAKYKYRVIGAFVMPFALLAMAWGQLYLPTDINPLMPALQSNWLLYHVLTCFLGYAGFAVACGVSIMYLIKVRSEEKGTAAAGSIVSQFPPTKVLDELNYKAIMIGFPLLTLGIITGAAWANYAWGTYWSWDPKETWSLIVWFIYAAFLHARFTKGWVGKRAAWLSIIGFLATLFCYLGVNLLLSGLHSYGGL
ncbi:c-type cytochrome biogenesis protein CcsB [Trichlorobacter ammonificans]|uniref:Heme exporter protein C n=1 Tax=Trichlorobacter ammonificans TaxID=2916410 RepID=A0ABM9D3R5_9BACT|nr:c-type cytochrome biogenesis protein CcsB [Trichlorobacter ammonificans]CAH2029903.1 Cytochrome c biogenesis protein CcsA [Trichlorobacter ammonificans]